VLSANGGIAEIIPVEPDQGNACAGKVVPLFVYASLSQHFSQTIFSTNIDLNEDPDEKNVFGDLLLVVHSIPYCSNQR
jgi:hypothetical protein